jgi:hypothetical protein
MADRKLTRRQALQGGAALTGALALRLNGGPAGLFNSAGSFLRSGAFGVTPGNVRDLGGDLLVDADSLGALPDPARAHMASVNFRHGVVRPHEQARAAVLEANGRSRLLRMASAFPATGRRCAVVNDLGLPVGVSADAPPEEGVALERIVESGSVASRVGGSGWSEIRSAYGAAERSTISGSASTFAAVEALLASGTGVVFAQPAYTGRADRQFDTHEDDSGTAARAVMAPITPLLATFLSRVFERRGHNVVILLVGEFSRTVPKSDHEPGGTATFVGRYVRTGTAGPQNPDGSPPLAAPPVDAVWAYAAAALRLDATPFGRNPHPELIRAEA